MVSAMHDVLTLWKLPNLTIVAEGYGRLGAIVKLQFLRYWTS